ncbi:MAG: stage III sporulation protein AG [Lachnospiraceae bacterium]|nr:stage III sporulation protein AG [Lachnospiraceae bacterium]
MEDGKKPGSGLFKGGKLRKDQCLIIILTGVLLCVIVWPVKPTEPKSGISDIINDTMEIHSNDAQITDSTEIMEGSAESAYVGYWEDKLENTLSYVEGAGDVKVLLTLKESEERIVEKDGPEESSDTMEQDAAGGSRTVSENRTEKTTIYMTDEEGNSVPYVVKTIPPAVEGVVVIAQGADQIMVRQNIIEAIQVLFDIDMNKITVVKMKNNNQ